ncbi:MAG: CBS domain-containing protein [Chloroflexi bacterium]|nr:CBS domain-containing protein [Chloroflexota bacterium]
MSTLEPLHLSRRDFVSDQTIRWCPGCGDYAIISQVQKVLPDLGIPKENIVFISGIGCSSRFPYYMDTYGIHSIHGRAPTLATGLKIANPELSVWVITGDGDALSIGGNHIIHTCRRNVDLNIILFNNRIYGLTKGQYSPTSPQGIRTKSSPMGSLERPLNPISLALASEATFIARTVDIITKHMGDTFLKAARHKGISFVEVFQNCVIFNNGAWQPYSDRQLRSDNDIFLENGKPMIFGQNDDKGILWGKSGLEVVELGDQYSEDDLVVHDTSSVTQAWMLSRLTYPMPIGIILDVQCPSYEQAAWAQVQEAKMQKGEGTLAKLFHAADTWQIQPHDGDRPASQMTVHSRLPSNLDEAYMDDLLNDLNESELEERLGDMDIAALKPHAPILVADSARVDHAVQLMQKHNIGCLLVTSADGHLSGILTENDVTNRILGHDVDTHASTVAEYMTVDPVALGLDTPVIESLHLISTYGFRHLPVVDEHGLPLGILSVRDIIHFLATVL